MTLTIRCPHCSAVYKNTPEEALGKSVRCRQCGKPFTITRNTERPLAAEWRVGQVLLDLYRVDGVLGQGGFGAVYRAHHLGWGVDLAVKRPKPALLQRQGGIESIEREADTWVNLDLHPHILTCYYVRRIDDIPHIFIELIEGGNLAEAISGGQLYAGGTQRALARMLDFAIQFAWGLHLAHGSGLVHQDVKPANVMLTEEEVLKVTDFGLARSQAAGLSIERSEGDSLWQQAEQDKRKKGSRGTPAYRSPEQANREPLTVTTDVWSWATSVMHMFAGRHIWGYGETAVKGLLALRKSGPGIPEAPVMPAGLIEVLAHCLRHDPTQRPQDMQSVSYALIDVYREAIGSTYPRAEPKVGRETADSLNNRALSLLDLGRPEVAERRWEEALIEDPNHADTHYNEGLLRWRTGRSDDLQLLRELEEVRVKAKREWPDQLLMAQIHLERGDGDAALELIQALPEADRRRPEVEPTILHAQPRRAGATALIDPHGCTITALSFHREGRFVVTADAEGEVVLRMAEDGRVLKRYPSLGVTVDCAVLSNDSRRLLVHAVDGSFHMLSSNDGALLSRSSGPRWGQAVLVPEGESCQGIAPSFESIKVWDCNSGRSLRWFKEQHKEQIQGIALAPGGQLAVTVSDKEMKSWEVGSGRSLRTTVGPALKGAVRVATDGMGRFALIKRPGEGLEVWELETGRRLRTLPEITAEATAIALSPDATHLILGYDSGTLEARSLPAAAEPYAAPLRVSRVKSSKVSFPALKAYEAALTFAREAAAAGDYIGAARYIREARAQPDYERGKEALDLWPTLYHKLPKSGCRGGWHLATYHPLGWADQITFVGTGHHALAIQNKELLLWNATTGSTLKRLSGHSERITVARARSDGRQAASGSRDQSLRLWDLESGECSAVISGHVERVNAIALAPDSRFVVTGAPSGVFIWEWAGGKLLRKLEQRVDAAQAFDLSPDGRYLITANTEEQERGFALWELSSGEQIASYSGHDKQVYGLRFTPDGRFAVTASLDRTLRYWDLISGECLQRLEGHRAWVTSLALTCDGRFVLSGSNDRMLRIWDLESGQSLQTLSGHMAGVSSVALCANGRYAISTAENHTVNLWQLDWSLDERTEELWDESALPHLQLFLDRQRCYTPLAQGAVVTTEDVRRFLSYEGQLQPNSNDVDGLMDDLALAGFGWLRREGVEQRLNQLMARPERSLREVIEQAQSESDSQ